MFPLLPPPCRRLRGGRRRENRARTAHGHQSAHSTTWSRPLRSACPPTVSPVAGTARRGLTRIHWGLIRPYHNQAESGEDGSRPLDQTVHPNSVANLVWQRAEARNRSLAREPDGPSRSYPRLHHHVETSDRSRLGPRNRGTS